MTVEERNAIAERLLPLVDTVLSHLLKSGDRFANLADDLRGAGALALLEAIEAFPGDVNEEDGLRAYLWVAVRRAMLREAQTLSGMNTRYQEREVLHSSDVVPSKEDAILRIIDIVKATENLKGG